VTIAFAATAIALVALAGSAALEAPAATAIGYKAPDPLAVAVGPGGDVYLSDPGSNGQVQRFSSEGKLLGRWGHFGRSGYPRDIAVDAAGNVYVVGGRRDRLGVFTADGTPVRHWKSAGRAVAVGPYGQVYVEDGRVKQFAPDGNLVAEWGPIGGFSAIATGPSGDVYAVGPWSKEVQAFSAAGVPLTSWAPCGFASWGGACGFAYGIATDAAENVYVAVDGPDQVGKLSPGGDPIATFGSLGRGRGRLVDPMSVAVDSAGDVYVASHSVDSSYGEGGPTRVVEFAADGRFLTEWRAAPALPTRPRLSASVGHRTAKRNALFRFSSQPPDARFECRLGGVRVPHRLRRWRSCASPERYRRLSPGRKAFWVKAVSGGEASEQEGRGWTIVKRAVGKRRGRP